MKALLCVILDRSGSMGGRESDVIGGVNKFIEEQQKVPGEALISMVRFDTEYERFRPMTDIKSMEPMRPSEFVPRGSTALLDAIGRTLSALEEDWRREQPEKCIVVIVTDGQENASKEFTRPQIKEMISAREASGKWNFIYLGSDISTFDDAKGLGIRLDSTAMYTNNAAGIKSMYATVGSSVGSLRAGASSAGLGGVIDTEAPQQQPQPQPLSAAQQVSPPPAVHGTTAAWTPPQPTQPWTPPA